MAKKVEKYECDTCKELYDTEKEAKGCEEKHIEIKKCKLFYDPLDKRYPTDMDIYFGSDTTNQSRIIKYRRVW